MNSCDSWWGYVGSSWLQVGSKMAQDHLFWLKLAPRRPKWPLKTSQVPQDEAKMTPRWLPNRYVLASWSFFRDLLPDLRFPMYFCFSGALKASISDTFLEQNSMIFESFLASWVVYAPKGPHDCCRMAYLSLSGPNIGPSWLQVGSS